MSSLLVDPDERVQYLELKVKYLQSLSTIFRQKITLLLRKVSQDPQYAPNVEQMVSDLQDVVRAETREVSQHEMRRLLEEQEARETSLSAVTSADQAEYWRDQFLGLMHDAQPTSLQDAQVLCGILQEKNETASREADLRRDYDILKLQYRRLDQRFKEILKEKSLTADEALKELFLIKEHELEEAVNAVAYRPTQMLELTEKLKTTEQKNKALRLRVTELRQQLQAAQLAEKEVSSNDSFMEIYATEMRQAKSLVAVKDAEVRRLETDAIMAQKTLALRDNTIRRLQARINALETEVKYVHAEGLDSTLNKEASVLKRQIDTFEMHIRKLEHDAHTHFKEMEKMEKEMSGKNFKMREQELEIGVLKDQIEAYSAKLQNMEADIAEKDSQRLVMEDLQQTILMALHDIRQEHTTKSLAENVATVGGKIAELESKHKTLEMYEKESQLLRKQLHVYRVAIQYAQKFKVAPSFESIEKRIALDCGSEQPPDFVMREIAGWRELRDPETGKFLYITENIKATPFANKPPKAASGSLTPAARTPKISPAASPPDSPRGAPPTTAPKPEPPEPNASPKAAPQQPSQMLQAPSPSLGREESLVPPTLSPQAGKLMPEMSVTSPEDMALL